MSETQEGESEIVMQVAMAGIRAMTETAGRFNTDTMFAASVHILATWIAVESDYKDIGDTVKDVSEQLRDIVKSHVNDPLVRNLKKLIEVVGAH